MDTYYDKLRRSVLPGASRVIGGTEQIVPAICPYCGKSNEREFHCSYGPIFVGGAYGFKCFSCGTARTLARLHSDMTGEQLSRRSSSVLAPLPATRPVAYWRRNAEKLVRQYESHPMRFAEWRAYKNIPQSIVEKYRLGVGVLPQSRYKDVRLIVPIIENGRIVMLRGRRIGKGEGPKWTAAGGVSPETIQLPFADRVNSDLVFIVENPVDAIAINEYSQASAVAALSTNYWYPHWTARLVELSPRLVVTAYDHDIAGEGLDVNGMIKVAKERITKILASRSLSGVGLAITSVSTSAKGWRVGWACGDESGILSISAPAGVQRRNELLKAGIQVASMPWSDEESDKKDVGDLWREYSADSKVLC